MPESAVAAASRRVELLDFIRGFGMFGILMMSTVGMGLEPAYDNAAIAGATRIN